MAEGYFKLLKVKNCIGRIREVTGCVGYQVNMMIVELKSEAVKERHWKQLMRRLRVNWVLSELTLGHLWDIDLQKNEMVIRDVLLVAQGEMALEEFLKQVNEL